MILFPRRIGLWTIITTGRGKKQLRTAKDAIAAVEIVCMTVVYK